MNSGAKGGPSRVSIPSGMKKMIDNIKEITGQNHAEDEIYAMLKECSMDPNETTQRLLSLDTFHEVRRRRDRKKENLNKEPAELKWKSGAQVRPSRGGRGNYSSRYISHDTSGGRNFAAVKENAASHVIEKSVGKGHLVTSQETKKNGTSSVASQVTAVSNGPIKNLGALATKDIQQNQTAGLIPSAPSPVSCFSSSDPVLLPSPDTPLPSAVGTIRRSVGSQQATPELTDDNTTENKLVPAKVSASEVGTPTFKQKTQNDFPGAGKSQHDPLQTALSTVSRPPSNYSSRSQAIGPQKGVPSKEWKPKSANANAVQSAALVSSEPSPASLGRHPESETQTTAAAAVVSNVSTLELQKKLEDSHISDGKHVIIPNHLHVPDVQKLGFCFGSFDASFGLDMNQNTVPGREKSPAMSESSETIDESLKEPESSDPNVSVPAEDGEMKYHYEHPQSPTQEPDNILSGEVEVSSAIVPYYGDSKSEVAPENHQQLVVHTSNYNVGFMPPILGGQLTPYESSESQARDPSRLPGFIVQQSYDPASYYAQFYRAGVDSDGRISPFHSAGATNKYNGNAVVVSAQTSQTPQEGGIPVITSPTLMTQAAGVMQSSISQAQQPHPVFRQPAGVIPHYPPNYIPYGPYFSPYYIPPPAIHQFMGNGAFPQQPQAGSLYPSAPGTTAKYSVSQYKQGSNTGSSTHVGVPGSYGGPYGLPLANYASGSATTAVTNASNEENANAQMKENNIYVSGQQTEGSGVWFTTPMRDISPWQASSFYNLPQGQLAFTPAQPGHGAYAGIFHPAQAVTAANAHALLQQSQPINNAIDNVAPTGAVYQQPQPQPPPQHTQINWPSNY